LYVCFSEDSPSLESLETAADGCPSINRPAEPFVYCLNYLRTGKWHLPKCPLVLPEIEEEIKFYGLWESYAEEKNGLALFDDTTLMNEPMQDLINKWVGSIDQKWKLLYRSSRDGWLSDDFHRLCNCKGPTLTVVRAGANIFGGFNPLCWQSRNTYVHDVRTWLFSLTNNDNTPLKMCLSSNAPPFTIYDHADYGPTFGGGHDLCIQSNANNTTQNYTNLGYSFEVPQETTTQPKTFLTGGFYFTPDEIEVFGIVHMESCSENYVD